LREKVATKSTDEGLMTASTAIQQSSFIDI